jgi:hypothetical protein
MKNFLTLLFFKIWFALFLNKQGKPFWMKKKTWCLYWYKEDWLIIQKGKTFSETLYWGEDLAEGLRLLKSQ